MNVAAAREEEEAFSIEITTTLCLLRNLNIKVRRAVLVVAFYKRA
jgi:hypothetical protein